MAKAKSKGVSNYSKTVSAKLSSQNQITVPLEVREMIGAQPGDKILFVFGENQEVTVKVKKKESLLDLYGSMPPKGNDEPMEWEKIRKLAREEMLSPNEDKN